MPCQKRDQQWNKEEEKNESKHHVDVGSNASHATYLFVCSKCFCLL